MTEIPTFPNGREISAKDRPFLTPLPESGLQQVSECNFTNLFAWRETYNHRISMFDGFVVVSGSHGGLDFFMPPLGDTAGAADTAYKIFQASLDTGAPRLLWVAPTWLADQLKVKPNIRLLPDRDSWDYVYRSSDLAELPGQRYHAKKNLIRQFQDKYTYSVDALTAGTCREAIEFSDRWCKQRDCESDKYLEKERCAIYQMLTNFEALCLSGICIRIDGEIVALTLGEEMEQDTYIVHVEKGDQDFRGIYQFINREMARRVALRYKWINREQDMGVEGLRRAKQSYHPDHFVKKFDVEYGA